jgi:hypothetical protein
MPILSSSRHLFKFEMLVITLTDVDESEGTVIAFSIIVVTPSVGRR